MTHTHTQGNDTHACIDADNDTHARANNTHAHARTIRTQNCIVSGINTHNCERDDLLSSDDTHCINCFQTRCKCDCDDYNSFTQFASENKHLCDCDDCKTQ